MPDDPRKNILILTADAGYGHRSAAQAIKKALEAEYGGRCAVTINNPIDHPKTPKMLKDSQDDYDEIVKKLPDLYKMGFKASDATIPATLMEGGLIVLLFEVMQEILAENQPDLVITTYPTYQAPLDAINQLGVQHVPWITTITDLVTVHRLWLHPGAAYCMVPTEDVRQRALKAGLKPDRIIMSGIPVNPRIGALKSREKHSLRKSLGWHTDKTTILFVGGTRVTSLMDVLEVVDHSGFDLQLILIAGGNEDLQHQLEEIDWHHPAFVYGFVDDMPEFMRAADLIVCKAGGLIVTESLASGLPMILSQALPGQETGNADFVEKNGAGVLCQSPVATLRTLSHWLTEDGAGLRDAAARAESLGRADAAMVIAEHAMKVLQQWEDEKKQAKRTENAGLLGELLTQFKIPWKDRV
jgi:1,2-diacylglycerol 3-beta-galactosyltransferase